MGSQDSVEDINQAGIQQVEVLLKGGTARTFCLLEANEFHFHTSVAHTHATLGNAHVARSIANLIDFFGELGRHPVEDILCGRSPGGIEQG